MASKRLAFIYPGQGSQHIGMARDLFESSEDIAHIYHQAEITLGRNLTTTMFDGPEEELRNTRNAQPAIFLHEYAITRVLASHGVAPAIVAGHSVGEYAALVTANVIDYGHALWLIAQRGELMSEAGQLSPGTMAAVLGLDDAEVERCCREVGGNVVVANYNSAGQVVISGDKAGIDKAVELCKQAGAKRALPLAVSGAFHSPLVNDANATLAENIERVIFRDATIPVITNVDGKAHTNGNDIKANLLAQMVSSVRWTETMKTIQNADVDAVVEVGPGSVLTGLARRSIKDVPLYQLSTVEDIKTFLPELCAS